MKKVVLLSSLLLICVIFVGIGVGYFSSKEKSDVVPEGYFAVFHGGCCEVTQSTYVYKIDNGHANMGFKYVNTVNTTESWGSTNWIIEIVDEGEVTWTDDVFKVAKEHGAYSYVIEDGEKYTIEEYMNRFLMN